MVRTRFWAIYSLVFLFACIAVQAQTAPYPPSSVITDVKFNWSTLKQLAPGSDNWAITWADDGHQYTTFGDGGGFGGTNNDGRVSLGVGRVEGDKSNYKGYNRWGGKNAEYPAQFDGKSYGIISIGGVLYMWRSPGSDAKNYTEIRMARSTDHGAHWTLSSWKFTLSQDLIIPTILQFGKDYAGARDGYVYHYFIRPENTTALAIQKPGAIFLARVPKDKMMTQSAYQFVSGFSNGQPIWSNDISKKVPVFEDRNNGVGWTVSASYNPGLKRYLLITEHTRTYPYGGNIGIFDAPEPWGPWTTVLYKTPWEGTTTKCFFWNFSNKWLSADGKNFVLVYTGQDRWNSVEGTFTVGGGGSSSPSPTAPAAPTNLKITSLTASCVSKAWNASSDSSIAGYRVYRSTKSGSGYTLINSSLCKEPKYEDTNVAPGSTYYYTVTAVNTSGQESPKSNEVQAKVPSSSGGTNHPPSANSGGNQTVGSGATVILAGSATDPDGDALTYLWRQVGGSSISLSGANTPTASFRAPVVTKELKLVFDFVVSDGRGGTDSDRMAVYVKPGLSSTNNNPPTANAGPDLTTSPGAKVTLSGAGSDPDGNPLSFSWTQVSGPGVALSASGATATFTAPAVSADTTLVFRLTVNDGKGGSGSDDVKVLVKTKSSGVNQPPVAIPGPNQTVTSGAKVTLSGAGSYDPDGDPITYVQWKQISGPTVKLSSTSSLVTSFVAPKVTRKMEVILRLGIKDSHGAGDDDRVSVFIMP